jgi:hypothetical protein
MARTEVEKRDHPRDSAFRQTLVMGTKKKWSCESRADRMSNFTLNMIETHNQNQNDNEKQKQELFDLTCDREPGSEINSSLHLIGSQNQNQSEKKNQKLILH